MVNGRCIGTLCMILGPASATVKPILHLCAEASYVREAEKFGLKCKQRSNLLTLRLQLLTLQSFCC